MRVRTDPLTLAVALGLLGPSALQEGGMLEVHPEDAEEMVRVATDLEAPLPIETPDNPDTISYEVNLDGPEMGSAEE